MINKKKEWSIAEKYEENMAIKTPSLNQLVKNLSGGNQQKVILGRWLAADSELIIFDEPTRGIDVGAKYEIYKLMNDLVENQGKAVLMISSEMEELMGMSDRIIVLSEGNMTGELNKDEFSQETIMAHASAASVEEANMKENKITNQLKDKAIWLVLVILVIAFTIANERFINPNNILTLLRQVSMYGIASIGMTFVILLETLTCLLVL